MFTVKLYRDGGALRRISRADSITLGELEPDGLRVVTLHRSDGAAEEYFVGHTTHQSPHHESTYERAIVENSAGKTTEVIRASARSNDLRVAR
jgi:hypothetical protein